MYVHVLIRVLFLFSSILSTQKPLCIGKEKWRFSNADAVSIPGDPSSSASSLGVPVEIASSGSVMLVQETWNPVLCYVMLGYVRLCLVMLKLFGYVYGFCQILQHADRYVYARCNPVGRKRDARAPKLTHAEIMIISWVSSLLTPISMITVARRPHVLMSAGIPTAVCCATRTR